MIRRMLLVGIVTSIGLLVAGLMGTHYFVSKPYKHVETALSGLRTEAEVISYLGKPAQVVHKGNDEYYVKGYSFK